MYLLVHNIKGSFRTFNDFLSTLLISFFSFLPVNHFTFEIVEGNEERKFRIDPLVNKPLDYDYPVMDRNVSPLVGITSLRGAGLILGSLPVPLAARA